MWEIGAGAYFKKFVEPRKSNFQIQAVLWTVNFEDKSGSDYCSFLYLYCSRICFYPDFLSPSKSHAILCSFAHFIPFANAVDYWQGNTLTTRLHARLSPSLLPPRPV